MQIHEVTKQPLKEGLFDTFQSPEKMAARAAEKLRAQGYGQPRALPTVQDAVAGVQKNPAQQQYIKSLVAQWVQVAPKPQTAATTATAPGKQPTQPFAGRSAPLPTVTVDGKLLTKGPDGLWHGEDGRAVQDPAQIAKIDKAYYTGMPKQKGMVRERSNKSRQNATRRAARRSAVGQTTAPAAATTNPYQSSFEKWAAEKLLTRDPITRQMITLDDIKKTDIKDELDRALAQVVATAGDAQKNAVAVNNYLTIAVAGVARKSQELRQSTDTGGGGSGTAGGAIVTQQEIKNRLAQEVRLNSEQVEALKKIAQDPAARQALLKSLGAQA